MQIVFTEDEQDWVEVHNGVLRVVSGCPKDVRATIEKKLKRLIDYDSSKIITPRR